MSQSESSVLELLLEGQAMPIVVETRSTAGSLFDQSRRCDTGSGSNQDEVIVYSSTSENDSIPFVDTNKTGTTKRSFPTRRSGEDIDAKPPSEDMKPFDTAYIPTHFHLIVSQAVLLLWYKLD